MKNPFLLILTIIAIIYGVITYPFFYLKRKILRLDDIKTDIISVLNKIYGTKHKADDYQFENTVFSGLKIRKIEPFIRTFAKSEKVNKAICFKVFAGAYKEDFGLPVVSDIHLSLSKLLKLFEIEQSVYIHFEKEEITLIQLRITLARYLHHPNHPMWTGGGRDGAMGTYRINLQLNLTPDLEIINIQKIKIDSSDWLPMLNTNQKYTDFPFSDIALLIYLNTLTERTELETINDWLPELNIPSAYDFKSDDFRQRILLVEMMTY